MPPLLAGIEAGGTKFVCLIGSGPDDVRAEVQALLNGYVQAPQVSTEMERYVVAPALGPRVGVLGALAIAT